MSRAWALREQARLAIVDKIFDVHAICTEGWVKRIVPHPDGSFWYICQSRTQADLRGNSVNSVASCSPESAVERIVESSYNRIVSIAVSPRTGKVYYSMHDDDTRLFLFKVVEYDPSTKTKRPIFKNSYSNLACVLMYEIAVDSNDNVAFIALNGHGGVLAGKAINPRTREWVASDLRLLEFAPEHRKTLEEMERADICPSGLGREMRMPSVFDRFGRLMLRIYGYPGNNTTVGISKKPMIPPSVYQRWTIDLHATSRPEMKRFVVLIKLCERRMDNSAKLPQLPHLVWNVILSMINPWSL